MYKKSNKPAKKSAPHSKPAPQSQSRSASQSASQSRPQSAPQRPTPKPQPAPTWAKEDDMKELTKSLTYFIKASGHRFENAEKAIKDHEARLRALENGSQSASQPAAQSAPQQPAPQPVQQVQPASRQPKTPLKASGKPQMAFRVWDYKARCFWLTLDIFGAKQADPAYTPVWVWIVDGKIDRLLTEDEIKRHLP